MATKQQIADRAAELLGESHLLPESYAVLEAKHAEALSALGRMTDQRDQLAAQVKDATAQLARAGDLLRAARGWGQSAGATCLVDNINGYLAGEVLPPAVPEVVEALRKALNTLPRYSFLKDDSGGVRKVKDSCGNWVEWADAHALFDLEVVVAVMPKPEDK